MPRKCRSRLFPREDAYKCILTNVGGSEKRVEVEKFFRSITKAKKKKNPNI